MILFDVGVWLALVYEAHRRHDRVVSWVEHHPRPVALCRVTQMSLLRLLTNPAVMGKEVMTRQGAWRIHDELRAHERVAWLGEPAQLEPVWRAHSARPEHHHKLWTDDYLAAFAQAAAISLATLDERMVDRYPATEVIAVV